MPPARPVTACLLLFVALGSACGASQPPATTAADPAHGPVALPKTARELLPDDLQAAFRVDVAALRGSPLWQRGLQTARANCVELAPYQGMLERIDLVVGGVADTDQPRGATVLQGRLEPAAFESLLALIWQDRPGPDTRRPRGRFEVRERGGVAGASLADTWSVIGDPPGVDTILDVAEGKLPNAEESMFGGGLGPALGFDDASAAVIYRQSPRGRARLDRQLGNGAKSALPPGLLDAARGGLALRVADGVELRAVIESPSPQAAQELTASAQSSLFQANLLLRFAGLPAVLDRTEASTRGTLSVFSLHLSQGELDQMLARMDDFLSEQPSDCGTTTL